MIQLAKISAIYAAVFGIALVYLALRVVLERRRSGRGLGHGEDERLERAIRIHANAVEYVPIALILMVVFEINGGSQMLLHLLGSALIVARALHVIGLSSSGGVSFGRFYGIAATWLVILAAAVVNLRLSFVLG